MSDSDPRWTIVWQHAERRRVKLGMTKEALYAACGISEGTYRKMARGTPLARPNKKIVFCRGLIWTDDSIDRILTGDEPVPTFGDAADADAMRRTFAADVLADWERRMTAEGGPDLPLGGSSVEIELLKMAVRRLKLDGAAQISRLGALEFRSQAQDELLRQHAELIRDLGGLLRDVTAEVRRLGGSSGPDQSESMPRP